MLISVLHFNGNCADAIALYEKAFNTKAEGYDYGEGNMIRHAEMIIHEQKIYLNDGKNFIKNTYNVDCAAHLCVTFNTSEDLLACYDVLRSDDIHSSPFTETSYSKKVGNFVDRFGVLWGFMVT